MSSTAQKKPPKLSTLICGKRVGCTGQLASMSEEEFKDLVESSGGIFAANSDDASLLVVGQRDWPLTSEGELPQPLSRARAGNPRRQSRVTVLPEEDFLSGLGLNSHLQSVHPLYSTSTLTEILEVSRERVRAWVQAGLIRPAKVDHGVWYFDFRQVSAAKTLCDLSSAGVKPAQLRRSLEQLRTWMPDVQQPLEQLSVLEHSGDLIVRLEAGDLAAADGQFHFDFTDQPDPPPTLRLVPGPRTAGDFFAQAVEQEQAGMLREAAGSYREALLLGGPDKQVCFDLAGVLAETGELHQAAERYLQALEIDPKFIDAWNNLGLVFGRIGKHPEACAAFRRALAIDPDDSRACYNLADALEEMDRREEAADYWRLYLRQDTQSEWAAYARTRLAVS